MEDSRLLDIGGYPEISADGLANVLFHADKAHFVLFGWRNLDGVWRRVVVGTIMRPVSSVAPQQITALRAIYDLPRAEMRCH